MLILVISHTCDLFQPGNYDSFSHPFQLLSFSKAEHEKKKMKERESRHKRQSKNATSFEVREPSPESQRKVGLGIHR